MIPSFYSNKAQIISSRQEEPAPIRCTQDSFIVNPPEQLTLSEIKAEQEQAYFLQARTLCNRGVQLELNSVSYFGRIYFFQ